jgi:hypothetical protein
MTSYTQTPLPLFDQRCGPTVEPCDNPRLTKQHEVVRDLMLDGAWRTLAEIETLTGYPQASISAQLRHLRKERFGGYRVPKRRRSEGTWEYAMEIVK